jgi:PKD repeat protein
MLIVSIFHVSLGSILGAETNISINGENEIKNQVNDYKSTDSIDSQYTDDIYTMESTDISIVYPIIGKIYSFNTEGVYRTLISLLNIALVIDRNFETGATVDGPVDEVKFTLYQNKQEIETKTADGPNMEGRYTCRFYSITSFFGSYKITAVAYYDGVEVASNTVENIIYLHVGEGGNRKPVPKAEFEFAAWEGKEVDFDGSESYDPDGEIVSYHWDFGDGGTSNDITTTHIFNYPGIFDVKLTVEDNEGYSETAAGEIRIVDYDLGCWITTKYNGVSDEVKLDIGVNEFINMVYRGYGHRSYKLTMEDDDDTYIELRFGKTTINGISAVMTSFKVEVDQSTDLSEDFEVNLEFRFPYSLLLSPYQVPSEEYFAGRVGYHYYAEDPKLEGPHDVHTYFYFGKNSLQDPAILRMKIDPYPYGADDIVPLSYETKFVTVDDNKVEQFHRVLSLEFDPATELTITSVPREGKINYNFGSETAGMTTTISFRAWGGIFSDITQRFILDPLPSFMRFDLTVFGATSFLYEASTSYDLTYIVESEQSGEIVKLELDDLPRTIRVSWGLSLSLTSADGFIDLDMSSNLGKVKLYIMGSNRPFFEIDDFPRKLRVAGNIDITQLKGAISLSKYSGGTTTFYLPITFGDWEMETTVGLSDGSWTASFDLPNSGSNFVSVGLDTDGNPMFSVDFTLYNKKTGVEVIDVSVDALASDNLEVSFNNVNGQIQNFKWKGKITKFVELDLHVDYQSLDFNVQGSFEFFEKGKFLIELNKPVEVTFVDMTTGAFKLYGYISLYGDRKIMIDWELMENGHFTVYTFGQPVGNQFQLDFEYDPGGGGNYQYGFKITGQDFIEITRTIQWNTVDRIIPRIWILGDVPLPGDWDVDVLWKGEWYYDVPNI